MKYLGVLLCVYNLLLLPFIHTDWYSEWYSIIDSFDTPIYFLSVAVFVLLYKKLSYSQKWAFKCAYIAVLFKWLDYAVLNSSYDVYVFWNFLICGFMPLVFLHHEKINRKTLRP